MLGVSWPTPLGEVLSATDARDIAKHLGIRTVEELVTYYPRAYSRRGSAVDLGGLEEGETVTLVGRVHAVHTSTTRRRGTRVTRATIVDESRAAFTAVFFQARWVQSALPPGTLAMFSGTLRFYQGAPQLQHPTFLVLPDSWSPGGAPRPADPAPDREAGAPRGRAKGYSTLSEWWSHRDYLPIYPTRSGITSWRIMEGIRAVLEWLPPVADPLAPEELPDGMVSLDAALRGIHAPAPSPRSGRRTAGTASTPSGAPTRRRRWPPPWWRPRAAAASASPCSTTSPSG